MIHIFNIISLYTTIHYYYTQTIAYIVMLLPRVNIIVYIVYYTIGIL